MKTSEIRRHYLAFFEEKGHTLAPSSSLVPVNDPSLLFTNAGMVQFKDAFLGLEDCGFVRATTSQRCVRAGGKHNDLDNVGYTARHHTFFEMLGNFSFGDYFKTEAIEFAWELLTKRFDLAPEKLWVTVFEEDDEAAEIWLNHIGVDPNRLSRCGEKDNFWMMGDTGPCGPCSEIFYDHGEDIPGGPPGTPDEDGDRYVEIWNLVFMQYERDGNGKLTPIPKPSVDTGMGLERMAAVLQGVHNNYDIDLFKGLIASVRDLVPGPNPEVTSLRVIADHIRSCAFLIMDGVTPSNEGRGYVLRRIIRRALRHGNKLGITEPFFHRLVPALQREMGDAVPELASASAFIEATLSQEAARFSETLDQGLKIFESAVKELEGNIIPGEVAFKLNDTYGFPVDLTADIARERGLEIDMDGYAQSMNEQRERARAASQFGGAGLFGSISATALTQLGVDQEFCGYDTTACSARVLGIFVDGVAANEVGINQSCALVLGMTPFYGESGGQVGDQGTITTDSALFNVTDTQKQAGLNVHHGALERGGLSVGDTVEASVAPNERQAIRLNHSATHLLHAALRRVLGPHVQQKGSLVDSERLRFDFSHQQPVTEEELASIERLVNDEIRANHPIELNVMAYADAIDSGAVALFGEKYADEVRVLAMGSFSIELCGGTHAQRTGDIGLFKLTSESGVASGIRRIEALAGRQALDYVVSNESTLRAIAGLVKAKPDEAAKKIEQLSEKARNQDKEIAALKSRLAGQSSGDLTDTAVDVGEIKVIAHAIDGADMAALRGAMDGLKDRLSNAIIVLAAVEDDKVRLIAGVSKSLTQRFAAGDLVNHVAQQVGGKGGGRPDMAQAGGTDPSNLPNALASVVAWVTERAS
ncbi:MAG: alanyl-tRNA synthetase [Gammaproteobacteria bacterium]|jgi:alanyl-tRNA synthetase